MPLDEADLKHLWDMANAAASLVEFTAGVPLDRYLGDKVLRLATERGIEIVGEAARRVSPSGRAALPGLPWGAIVATRHILAHEYDDVDHEKIWRIATMHVPELIVQLKPILEANPPGPESAKDPAEP